MLCLDACMRCKIDLQSCLTNVRFKILKHAMQAAGQQPEWSDDEALKQAEVDAAEVTIQLIEEEASAALKLKQNKEKAAKKKSKRSGK